MKVVEIILIVMYIIVSLALIILALIQAKNDQGASEAIMGGASESFYEKHKGRTTEGKLKRWTIILGFTFALLSIVLSIIYMM
ncbi:MAG: preprotein translocase subunit SecG [Firmicutes bacterium]|nr:preprotein translocase subunit SecG [Bacillota bacterium]